MSRLVVALRSGDKRRALSRQVATGRALDKRSLLADLRNMSRDRVWRDIILVAEGCRDLLTIQVAAETVALKRAGRSGWPARA